jgi:hypothetical protein
MQEVSRLLLLSPSWLGALMSRCPFDDPLLVDEDEDTQVEASQRIVPRWGCLSVPILKTEIGIGYRPGSSLPDEPVFENYLFLRPLLRQTK